MAKSARIKTPKDAKGIAALKILEKTLNSVNQSRIPAKSAANAKHCHFLNSQRDVKRIDRQDWEARIGEMQKLYENHRYQRVNALHNALDNVKGLLQQSRAREQQLAETTGELERTSGYLQTLMDAMSDMLVATDLQGLVTEVNQACVRMSGIEKELILGKSYSNLFTSPEGAEKEIEATYEQKNLHDLELELQITDGETLPLLLNTTLLSDENGIPTGLLINGRDISELNRAREAQAHYAEELARANADLEEFATVASHDLQEPLKNVAKYAVGLSERYSELFDERAMQEVSFMLEQTVYMRELIKNVLDYARVDTSEEFIEDVDCDVLLEQVKKNLAEAMSSAGVVLTYDPMPTVKGSAGQLIRVFENILSNAVKYSDEGKDNPYVHIRVETLRQSSYAELLSVPGYLFSFQDNGLGIEEEFIEDVFKMFVRLHPEKAGSGLGLAIVEKIVRRHHGKIWVESVPEEGSVFYLALPR